MFVIDFAPHLPKKTLPARNVRISPDSATLAATFGLEGGAKEVGWWNLITSAVIGSSSILSPDWDDEDYARALADPVFLPNLARCAVHGYAAGSGSPEFHYVSLIAPGERPEQGIELIFAESFAEAEVGLQSLAISPDGRWLLGGHGQSRISRWDLKPLKFGTKAESARYEGKALTLSENDSEQLDETALAICSDAKRLACGLIDGAVRLHRFKSGKLLDTFATLPVSESTSGDPVYGLTFSPNGGQLACRADGRITLLDLANGQSATLLKPKKLTDMAFTPDGRRLLTGSSDKLVRVWDTATWQEVAQFDWKIGAIASVTVSPDGTIAAAGGENSRVVVWDLEG